jgi:CRISPR/Cas system endoribonuclease Cas6 (RAMP superfamily)
MEEKKNKKIKFSTYSPLYVSTRGEEGYFYLGEGRRMTSEEFLEKTKEWHNNDYEGELHEFLHMTEKEYAKYVEGKK